MILLILLIIGIVYSIYYHNKTKEYVKYRMFFVLKFEKLNPNAKYLNEQNITIDRIVMAKDDSHAQIILLKEIKRSLALYESPHYMFHVLNQSIEKI